MNIAQIEANLLKLVKSYTKETFIYDLLLAYGLPKATITRLKKGSSNLSMFNNEVSLKKKLFFKEEDTEDLHLTISKLEKLIKHGQRFIVVTDYKELLAVDTKTKDKLDIQLNDLPKHYDFFLPWAGMEKSQHQDENPADVKAAEKMAKLFDEIKKDNPDESPEFVHALNVFLSRLLFCFFAEDTNIFTDNQVTYSIGSHTQADGSDLHDYLEKLFEVLDTPKEQRADLPEYLSSFPYVNGNLFKDKLQLPVFTRHSRKAIIDSGELDWSGINPDIFGSMIQAVISPEHRGGLGMHYTSVPNIMKVIKPLFLDDLYIAYDKIKGNPKKTKEFLARLTKIKIFDPACGSGNFLIIAYKELRKLEMKIFKESGMMALSGISLSQFYGIELDDFAHEIAQLSLWLAEHQMNTEFFKEFGRSNPTLPLKQAGKIVHGNACRVDWKVVCPNSVSDEIYIMGNPPYLGAKRQDKSQKEDIAIIFKGINGYKNLDYIACWFYLGANYIKKTKAEIALVSTNSICQGDQVGLLWQHVLNINIEIGFAHQSFKWENNAKGKAAVICVIVSLRNYSNRAKYIFNNHSLKVNNISPYLINAPSVIVGKRNELLSNLPEMVYGNMPLEGGFLKLSENEREKLLLECPSSKNFIRPVIGGEELLKSIKRYCLWINDDQIKDAFKCSEIEKRINGVKQFRINGGDVARTLADRPHQFRYRRVANNSFLVIPCTTSMRREFMQCGYFSSDYISMNSLQVIYDSEPFVVGLISSKMHMCWVKTVAGRLKEDYRYSTQLCYNTFPFPPISNQRKEEITQNVFRILEEREKHSEKTLAQLYDPDKMPDGLREAHHQNDLAIERCYRSTPFESDEQRLEQLFRLYEKMIEEEKNSGGLFEKQKKTRKRK